MSEENTLSMERADEEYEVITSEEVDSILDGLDALIGSTQSENIRLFLEEAANNIFSLVYSDDEDAGQEEAA
ncbi:hypothetical protein [Planctomicrobium sp. SH527]|uniref:hypothetical protein n=1 Tax=Planctomicrobium sp. SH527 TaxID=3448123 RepID=UPI003F5B1D0E